LPRGTFQVNAAVNYKAVGYNGDVALMKGGPTLFESVQHVFCSNSHGDGSVVLACTVSIGKGEQLWIRCWAGLASTSFLTLTRVGR
jgi:hypothetical protein